MTGTVTETNRVVESINIHAPSGNSDRWRFTVWYTTGEFRQTWGNVDWIIDNYRNWAEQQGVDFDNLPPRTWTR